ncbi:MAG: type II secretion system protein [Candidatus Eremiobacteraeota bacterium]|nr:type II secretion system protein [Candidatus Eremiobacteraeota bacterium]
MRRGSRGFSLGEVLVSLIILSTLSVVLVGVIPATVSGLKDAGRRADAAVIAQGTLELLKRDGFDLLPEGAITTISQNGTTYDVSVELGQATTSDGTPIPETVAKDVRVIVQWKVGSGIKKHVTRTTFYDYI